MTSEQRRNWLLKTMRKQTDQWLQEDKYEEWQKKKEKHGEKNIKLIKNKRGILWFNRLQMITIMD